MANEGSAAMVFEHPLQPGDSFTSTGASVNLAPEADRKNPDRKNPGGFSVDAALGSAGSINLGVRGTDGNNWQNPPAASAAAAPAQTPPMPSMSDMAREVQSNAMQQAAFAGASQVAQSATSMLQKGATAAVSHVNANPYSVTLMSFIGGLVLALSSLMHLVWIVNIFKPLPYILRIYELCFGLLIIVIDGPTDRFPESLRQKAYGVAPFTQTNTQRILFYLFIACLQGSLDTWFNFICGCYFAIVAFFFAMVTLAGNNGSQQQVHGQGRAEEHGVPLASGSSGLH